MTFEDVDRARFDALWREKAMIEAVILADAHAAYYRECARASEAAADHIVKKIWPESRRDELTQYRHPGAVEGTQE